MNGRSTAECVSARATDAPARYNLSPAAILVGVIVAVFLSRYLTRGDLYFVDGPRLVAAIEKHVYVIQSPGYWLFARTASLFPKPAQGLQFLNEIFSALGSGMFLLVSLDLGLSLGLSLLATAAFSSIFFVWFAGTIHSVYASQMLFPVLAAWLFIRYVQRKLLWLLLAASISSAFGAGMRPSDGFFLFPLLAFVTFRYVKNWAHRSLAAATYGLVCLGWYLPTLMASHQANQTLSGQLAPLTHTTSLVFGAPLTHVAANMLRVLLPGLAAFWMLLPAWFLPRSRQELFVILLWVLPGCLFLLVVYMADAPYLTFMVAPLILLAALSRKRRLAFTSLAACALWNCLFFLCARPLANRSLMASSINYYTVKYTRYGLVHHWSSTVHDKSNSIP